MTVYAICYKYFPIKKNLWSPKDLNVEGRMNLQHDIQAMLMKVADEVIDVNETTRKEIREDLFKFSLKK